MNKSTQYNDTATGTWRRYLALMLAASVALSSSMMTSAQVPRPTAAAPVAITPRAPEIAASSYILIDAATGHIIMEQNSDEALPPASLTKIMTAYVAEYEIDNGNLTLDDQVFISERAWRTQGSKTFVDVNSYVRVEDLMRGIIIQSGNDASVAMAEHIAGSEEAFADLMNQHARRLGMNSSYFVNSSGLDDTGETNLMSARDLATLARVKILEHPVHYRMYAEREFTFNGIRQSNRNTLLFRDNTVDGMKTGWTTPAGFCLVASAQRDGMRLISVVMGTASEEARAVETQKLLSYGFRFFETHKLYDAGQSLESLRVWSAKENNVAVGVENEVWLTIPRGRAGDLVATLNTEETLRGAIEQGQVLGTVNITLGDEVLYSGNVVALQGVERGGLLKRLLDALTLFFMGLFS
ncbi:MAG: D-alanyl-D-alanine carboxypeptidase family protein [Pseudohongiella sp.]|nr:D-alanyl-D-alanine carboxypeptidase family protein [Pseudohongiella sp.]MDO9518644.1 D-alanyl-D-alanine carboxypeptidase family protein [Pseudohongiella sp.]MDP2128417.1 D-alanyl-D-alanine carboxypeptidase family protein [Pseudohongiella sp.]